jgi:hypothetical protein
MRQSELISDIINGIAESEREVIAEDDRAYVNEELKENAEENEKEKADATATSPEVVPVDNNNDESGMSEVLESGGQPRRSARIASGVKPPERYVPASFVKKDRWKEDAAKEVIKAEIKQLFKDLSALEPVKATPIVAGACVLTCHMFLVEKFLANGDFDKMKARLVSHGNKQNREEFPDWSSPTVAIHSVMMVLELFARNMGLHMVCKVDVKGAFVQTPM